MLKRLKLAAVATVVAVAAGSTCLAQTASSLSLKDATATTRTLCETLDGNGNLTPCLQVGAAMSALQISIGGTAHADAQAIYGALTGPLTVTGPLTAAQLAAAGLATAGGKVDTVIVGTSVDRGALVGTTSVTLMAANTSRRGFSIQVQSSSASCYMSGLGTATADYHSLLIGGSQPTYYETKDSHIGQGAISLICTAANTPVYSREW